MTGQVLYWDLADANRRAIGRTVVNSANGGNSTQNASSAADAPPAGSKDSEDAKDESVVIEIKPQVPSNEMSYFQEMIVFSLLLLCCWPFLCRIFQFRPHVA